MKLTKLNQSFYPERKIVMTRHAQQAAQKCDHIKKICIYSNKNTNTFDKYCIFIVQNVPWCNLSLQQSFVTIEIYLQMYKSI